MPVQASRSSSCFCLTHPCDSLHRELTKPTANTTHRQHAFKERKRAHERELCEKIKAAERANAELRGQNERLKQDLERQMADTESARESERRQSVVSAISEASNVAEESSLAATAARVVASGAPGAGSGDGGAEETL